MATPFSDTLGGDKRASLAVGPLVFSALLRLKGRQELSCPFRTSLADMATLYLTKVRVGLTLVVPVYGVLALRSRRQMPLSPTFSPLRRLTSVADALVAGTRRRLEAVPKMAPVTGRPSV